jgi:uncharacterized protein involved in exopolysaccharide biosynthesis
LIKAYWLRILVLAFGGAALALAISLMMPKKYEAIVDILIDQSTITQPAFETQGQSVQDALNFGRSRNIITQVEQLQSLGVVTDAATKVAERYGKKEALEDSTSELNPQNLQREISISADQNSDVISLRVRLQDRKLAEDVAQEMYVAFMEQNRRNSRELADRAILSLKSQSDSVNTELKALDMKSRDLRAKSGMPDVADQVQQEISAINQLKQARDIASMDSAGAHRTVAVLSDELTRTPKQIPLGTTTATNPVYERLETDLIGARSDRATLLAKFLPDSDQVKAQDERIKGIEEELKKLKHDVNSASQMGPNQNYMALQARVAESRAAADSADQRLHVAEAALASREKVLQTLPPIQTELASLARQQQSLEKIYFGYQDQLKTLQASRQGRTSPAQEITPATSFPDPVSPKPLVNGMFGLLAGLILGVVSMLYSEAKRQPVRSLAQLNGLALRPVYRLIPELREPFRGLQKAPPEAYESLLANFFRSDTRPYRMAVVGINKDSGASVTAVNVAIAASRHGSKVLLVQCDPKGALARATGKEIQANGQTFEVAPLVTAIVEESAIGVGDHAAGIAPRVTAAESDLTIIDLEPATRSAEYAFLAPYVDEVVLLVRAGRSRSVEFLQVQQALRDAGCKQVTVVFTRSSDFSVVVDAVEVDVESSPEEPQEIAVLPVRTVEPRAEATEAPRAAPEPPARPAKKMEPKVVSPAAAVKAKKRPPTPQPERTANPWAPEAAPEPPAQEVAAATAPAVPPVGAESPFKRVRTVPTVSIEDFGGIARVKAPEKPEPKEEDSEPRRRSRIDTSDIDS